MPKSFKWAGIGSRIAQTRAAESRVKFAARVGMPHVSTHLTRYESGEREPPSDLLLAIARTCGVSVEWLLTGEGVGPDGAAPAPSHAIAGVAMIKRLSARAGAGVGDDADDSLDEPLPLDMETARSIGYPTTRLRAAKVVGESMRPELNDGDTVIIAADPEARDGICAIVFDGTVRVKMIQAQLGGRFDIVSINPEFPRITVGPDDDVRVIGRVVLSIKKR